MYPNNAQMGYGQPQMGYGQPQMGYGQPQMGYGQPQMGYGQPQMAQGYGGGQVIIVQNEGEATITNMTQLGKISKCQLCRKETDNVMRPKIGGVTIAWCFCLFITTGVLCFVPFCCDGCKDTEVVCQGCQMVKTTVQANCC